MAKIKKEQLDEIIELQTKLNGIISNIGVLETQKHNLLHAFANIQAEQEQTKSEIEEKHGKINVNLEDGSFEEINGGE